MSRALIKKIKFLFSRKGQQEINGPSKKLSSKSSNPSKTQEATNIPKLVKNRPFGMPARRYEVLELATDIDPYFNRLKNQILHKINQSSVPGRPPKARLEIGVIGPKRPYLFVQHWSETGWLIERSDHGWVVSRADKIEHQKTFMREANPIDIVTLHRPQEGSGLVRINSYQLSQELVSYQVYEQMLLNQLALGSP